jgi:hypothetical protein
MKTSSIFIPGRVAGATAGHAAFDSQVYEADLPDDIARHLARVLDSPLFRRARRDGPLLRYLVCASVGRGLQEISEYAIGIDVYRRDPRTYSPGEDPIVRVQMGRLRQRLASYYHELKESDRLRFSIPGRAYVVRVEFEPETPAMRLPVSVTIERPIANYSER